MTEKKQKIFITTISILIPVCIAGLFQVKINANFSFLPPVYATINGITVIILCMAYYFIKKGNKKKHELMIKICFLLSSLFLIMYILYHATSDETTFGGTGLIKYVYYFLLISHIVLSIGVIPLVLRTYLFACIKDFERHKKIAKYSFFLWVYVAVSGVMVYLLISPYYV